MTRQISSQCRWSTIVLREKLPYYLLHLYPVGRGVAVPYPTETKLRLTWDGELSHTISLEGGRLGYPDGVSIASLIEGALPESIKNQPHFINSPIVQIDITLTTAHPKVDLSSSRFLLEDTKNENSCHRIPLSTNDDKVKTQCAPLTKESTFLLMRAIPESKDDSEELTERSEISLTIVPKGGEAEAHSVNGSELIPGCILFPIPNDIEKEGGYISLIPPMVSHWFIISQTERSSSNKLGIISDITPMN
jgi:hypothetical protein